MMPQARRNMADGNWTLVDDQGPRRGVEPLARR
jgi:hypothetical protein